MVSRRSPPPLGGVGEPPDGDGDGVPPLGGGGGVPPGYIVDLPPNVGIAARSGGVYGRVPVARLPEPDGLLPLPEDGVEVDVLRRPPLP